MTFQLKLPILVISLAALALAGCTSIRSYHGYVPETTNQGETFEPEVGVDTRATLLTELGEPSTIGTFDRDVWYYISSRLQQRAFLKEETTWRNVKVIRFDPQGVVASIEEYNLEDGQEIASVARKTPTRGKELSFLEQLLGNVGRLPTEPGPGGPGGR